MDSKTPKTPDIKSLKSRFEQNPRKPPNFRSVNELEKFVANNCKFVPTGAVTMMDSLDKNNNQSIDSKNKQGFGPGYAQPKDNKSLVKPNFKPHDNRPPQLNPYLNKSKKDLLELRGRLEKTVNNCSILSRLPDRGGKIKDTIGWIDQALEILEQKKRAKQKIHENLVVKERDVSQNFRRPQKIVKPMVAADKNSSITVKNLLTRPSSSVVRQNSQPVENKTDGHPAAFRNSLNQRSYSINPVTNQKEIDHFLQQKQVNEVKQQQQQEMQSQELLTLDSTFETSILNEDSNNSPVLKMEPQKRDSVFSADSKIQEQKAEEPLNLQQKSEENTEEQHDTSQDTEISKMTQEQRKAYLDAKFPIGTTEIAFSNPNINLAENPLSPRTKRIQDNVTQNTQSKQSKAVRRGSKKYRREQPVSPRKSTTSVQNTDSELDLDQFLDNCEDILDLEPLELTGSTDANTQVLEHIEDESSEFDEIGVHQNKGEKQEDTTRSNTATSSESKISIGSTLATSRASSKVETQTETETETESVDMIPSPSTFQLQVVSPQNTNQISSPSNLSEKSTKSESTSSSKEQLKADIKTLKENEKSLLEQIKNLEEKCRDVQNSSNPNSKMIDEESNYWRDFHNCH